LRSLHCTLSHVPAGRFMSALVVLSALALNSGCMSMYFHESPAPLAGPPPPLQTLDNLETREGWHLIFFKGNEKIGFYRYSISLMDDGNYRVQFQSLQRFRMLGIKKEIHIFEEDVVTPDFRLVSTVTRQVLDGKEQTTRGTLAGGSLRVEVSTEHQEAVKDIPIQAPLYPEAAMDFLPVLKGLVPGREYRYHAFSPATQSVGEVVQRVVRYERSDLLNHDAYRVKTSFQNIEANSWFNDKGEKVLEILLGGIFISERRNKAQVQQFILDKTLAKSDLMLDFSRVTADRPIPSPGSVRSLTVEIQGLTDERLVIRDPEQEAMVEEDRLLYEIRRLDAKEERSLRMPMVLGPEMEPFLLPSFQIQSRHPDILRQAREIAGDAPDSLTAVRRLAMWVGREIEDDLVESFSAVDVLKTRKGECQAHTFLYTALARALNIPTRVVSGLVYVEDVGFLFHAWAESFVGWWISVDPTMKQVPSDATHIKMVIGEKPEGLHLMVNVLGQLRASIKSYEHWKNNEHIPVSERP